MVQCRASVSSPSNRKQKKRIDYLENRTITINDLTLSKDIKKTLYLKIKETIDPSQHFYKHEDKNMPKPIRIKAIHNTDYDNNSRNLVFDPILEDFVLGSKGVLSSWEIEQLQEEKYPLAIRGLASGSQRAIKHCQENNIDFYAIDTGYYQPNTKKDYHRITKNALQNLGPIKDRPFDRLQKLNWRYKKPPQGNKILICPPSEKVMKFYNLDLENWLESVIDQIKSKTNKPIEIRKKPARSERVTTNTIWQALDDTFCLVTFNSIAATEAILYSVPAITLAPNAASVICDTDLDSIRKPNLPEKETIIKFAAHLSYCQFTSPEMKTGYAWKIINEDS